MLNLVTPLTLSKSELKSIQPHIDATNALRKIRNDLVHGNLNEDKIEISNIANSIEGALRLISLLKEKIDKKENIISSNKDYTVRYFNGRIKPEDIERAEIEILFQVNDRYYRIIRGFNDRESLKLLEIYKIIDNKKQSLINITIKSPRELNKIYEDNLTEDIGIGNFEYFIFYQLYVFTFDENRRMIFWDEKASINVLSIAFNYDLNDTDRILKLKKEMESLESYGRNARWQATQIKNEYERLLATKKEKELTSKHFYSLFFC